MTVTKYSIGRKHMALAAVLLLASGCEGTHAVPPEAGYQAPASMGRLVPAETGPDTRPHQTGEFEPPSGVWFNGQGIATAIAAGSKMPGEEVSIQIEAIKPEQAKAWAKRSIRYKLTERDPDGRYLRTVDEKVGSVVANERISSYQVKLPDKADTYYWLTAEVMYQGKVEDTLLSRLEVPLQEAEAELKLDQSVYERSGTMKVTLTNRGPTSLFFGEDYRFERQEGGDWVRVGTGLTVAIVSIGHRMPPGGQWEQTINFKELAPGLYRVGKEVEGVGTPLRFSAYAEFRIE
ncbi:immunoglobulin-like domain-containing protein [Paenibacillus puerhi]|uniref:immunoglobulin-like domain-containing protein n=1 Tax=Paenibacillus puerhi TaxID=2692622 RepID=UPI0013597F56|nr:immunoglobulin-like domain-containing protein [Paenibacillus puerhi]